MNNDNTIYITDEAGNEKAMEILFTCDLNGKQCVLVYEKNKEDDIYAFAYDEEGNLEVLNDEEMQMVDEILAAFEEGQNEEEA